MVKIRKEKPSKNVIVAPPVSNYRLKGNKEAISKKVSKEPTNGVNRKEKESFSFARARIEISKLSPKGKLPYNNETIGYKQEPNVFSKEMIEHIKNKIK